MSILRLKVLFFEKIFLFFREHESAVDAKKHLMLSKFTISSGFQITSVSCGKEHTLALTNTGRVYSFGLGSRGQLGTGSLENNEHPSLIEPLQFVDIVMVAAAGWHSIALSGIFIFVFLSVIIVTVYCFHTKRNRQPKAPSLGKAARVLFNFGLPFCFTIQCFIVEKLL